MLGSSPKESKLVCVSGGEGEVCQKNEKLVGEIMLDLGKGGVRDRC